MNIKIARSTIYILTFFFTLHLTPAIYINSSYLSEYINPDYVGFIYTFASIVTVLSLLGIRKVLKRIGNFQTIFSILLVELISLLTLAFSNNPHLVITAFILTFVATSLTFFNLDIFLESLSENSTTGGTRGVFLTSLNTAFILGPLITGLLIDGEDFWKVYLMGAILLIPVFYILVRYMKDFKDPVYHKPHFLKTAKKIFDDFSLRSIFSSVFLLRFFFSWMIIYIPIYLHNEIGFSLADTSLIIGIALIPFIILEAPLGKIADKYLGEKEILTAGFIITAGATMVIPFIEAPIFWLWAIVLFTTRIGASMIEVMTETYLFKKINASSIDVVSSFRMVRPIAYIVSPIIASILLIHIDFKYIFLILGAIILYGIRFSLVIKDTK